MSFEFLILLTLVVICGILIAVSRYYKLMMISGFSMFPYFRNNELVIVKKRNYALAVGKVYAFFSPDGLPCVKRLHKIAFSATDGKLSFFFTGDNIEDSIDSRSYGFIDRSKVIGEVLKLRWRN